MSTNRTQDYYRKVRKYHINRKKRIEQIENTRSGCTSTYYPNLGYYSKNKVHCSCPMCSVKSTRDILHRRDASALLSAIEQTEDLGAGIKIRGKIPHAVDFKKSIALAKKKNNLR